MKKWIIIINLIILLLVIGLNGCIDDYIKGIGKIQYNDFEGGFYGIVGDKGEYYDPINLPSEFKEDGLQVRYTIKILENQTSIHMWGSVVKIIRIEKL
jgi:inhibitor of cysteine peptidase